MLLHAEDRVGQARAALESNGLVAADLLSADIRDSWQRCLASGLDPTAAPRIENVGADHLRRAREQRAMVHRLASAELRALYQQIAGSNFMVALAAPDGLLLEAIADPSFAREAQAAAIEPGTIWDELHCGTNALGTTIATGTPQSIHGGEHFFRRHNAITCVAAPVFGPDGALACVLDASSDCRSRQSHTRALVGMAAIQIENLLLRETHARHRIIAFHSRPEYLSTLSAGILVFSESGRVLAANRQARFLLAGLPVVMGRSFDAIFRTGFGAFHDACARGDIGTLEDRVGSVYVATLETPKTTRSIAVGAGPPIGGPQTRPEIAAPDFVADDPAVAAALRLAASAAARNLPLLIRGATGTGKELLARYAHAARRPRGPFVPVNCAALAETLIEAELFGYADGAYTGARRGGAPGLVAEADGGTLFLDEIGDMKRPLQAVLLRLLDDWTIRPIGSTRARTVDVLLIAATNADLDAAVAAGQFRADLLYRLNTAEVRLPTLNERRDFTAIARHLLARFAPGTTITDEAAHLLAGSVWRGNIRELKSALLRLAMQQDGGIIDGLAAETLIGQRAMPSVDHSDPHDLRDIVRARIRAAFRENGGNISATARSLGVSRNTVYRGLDSANP
ncbi:sigma-54-dependent Fis family transcriptional regulator [Acidiphilium sp. PA]|uniref:sigma-54-dependent Fis family transcriptional regulator n=1 Tax=Acidiphilium sp. PA TaxID=2871705 RepID=UPI0022431DB0|nr:sigma-54-dependent Fis family transcriptional regulator [Acidiphilium sp. PA]MCW8305554.1 sigma-54-dependent Fis family transcriptional regulator [Acidiphilium sp. PA]